MKQFSLKKTIRGRLLLLAIGVEVLMLTILVSNSLRLLHGAMTNQAHTQVQEYSPVLVAALTAPLAQRDYSTLQAIITESQQSGGINYIVVVDRTGKRVVSSGWATDQRLPEPVKDLPLFEKKKKMRYDVVVPLSLNGQPLGTLHYGLDLSHIISARRVLLTQGLGIAAVEIVLSSLILLLIGYWLTRHLTTLTQASLEVASGNLTPAALPEGKDDLGQLGIAFNTMSRVIADRVSELTAAKEAAETSETRLRSISDSAIDAILMMNPRGAISYWNPAAERILGYSPEEALGKDLHDLLVPEQYHADFHAAFPEFLRSGTGNAIGKALERVAIRKDGQEIEVALSLSPAWLDGAWHAVGMLRDITSNKNMERNLSKLSAAVEHSPVSIIITNRDGAIEYANPKFCQFTGYSVEEVLGQNPLILQGGEHTPEYYQEMWETILSGNEWRGEFYNRIKDGTLVWERASISPIRDESGSITHFVGVKEDISEEKRLHSELARMAESDKSARDQAEQANMAKSDFLASMSHEIRTPLNAILGMTDLLVETELNNEQGEYLAVVRSAGETLQGLIDDILDLSKIEAGMVQLDPTLFNLPDFLHQLLGMMSVRAYQKNLSLTSSLALGVPDWLVGDSFRLRQILLNLIGNAIKFTEQGSVELRVEPIMVSDSEIKVLFSITDTGIGISPDKRLAVFDAFRQADTSTTRNYGGSGLGLAISQRLVEMMGGEISVESTLGIGSCFHFTCCFGAPTDTPSMRVEKDTEERTPGRNLSILLVDDNKDNRTVLSAYFRRTEHSVAIAVNGAEAVAKIKQGNFDLVLMDMEMPVMDGYTAVRLIREWESETGRNQLPIIALTANALKEDRQKSFDAGCSDHLTKPIHKEKLLEVVEKYAGV